MAKGQSYCDEGMRELRVGTHISVAGYLAVPSRMLKRLPALFWHIHCAKPAKGFPVRLPPRSLRPRRAAFLSILRVLTVTASGGPAS
jgi:hypothetical protein